jgi:hypothetical protein
MKMAEKSASRQIVIRELQDHLMRDMQKTEVCSPEVIRNQMQKIRKN